VPSRDLTKVELECVRADPDPGQSARRQGYDAHGVGAEHSRPGVARGDRHRPLDRWEVTADASGDHGSGIVIHQKAKRGARLSRIDPGGVRCLKHPGETTPLARDGYPREAERTIKCEEQQRGQRDRYGPDTRSAPRRRTPAGPRHRGCRRRMPRSPRRPRRRPPRGSTGSGAAPPRHARRAEPAMESAYGGG
jgi:hypothetical protein